MWKEENKTMITNLNEPIKATKGFEKLPDGTYHVKVEKFEDWKTVKVKNARIKERDEQGRIVKGSFLTVDELEFYTANITYVITEGEHTGRKIFANLSTHPDQAWSIGRFVYALGLDDVTPAELPMYAVTGSLKVTVAFVDKSYDKTVTDPDTGMETVVSKETTRAYINEFIKA